MIILAAFRWDVRHCLLGMEQEPIDGRDTRVNNEVPGTSWQAIPLAGFLPGKLSNSFVLAMTITIPELACHVGGTILIIITFRDPQQNGGKLFTFLTVALVLTSP